jgi:outer membrane biosynthesis protein TonB
VLDLRFTVPGQSPQTVAIESSRMLIGTLLSNHVVLRAADVEPIHAMIEEVDGQWLITDLGSAAGVRLNGVRIQVESAIKPSDTITIGTVNITVGQAKEIDNLAATTVVPAPSFNKSAAAVTAKSEKIPTTGAQPESVAPGRATEKRDPVPPAAQAGEGERRVERKDVLFSPRNAKPAGSVLECVAYWGDTVLDTDLFHPSLRGFEQVTIGDPTKASFIAAGETDITRHVMADVSEDGYRLNLLSGMEARLRKGGQVDSVTGSGSHKMGRRDIAHIKFGSVRYFLMFCSPPALDLPRTGPRDPFFLGLSVLATLIYMAVIVPIALTSKPDVPDELTDDEIAIINIPVKEQPKPKEEKPKVEVAQVKTEPETPPVPKPPPQKPKPVEPEKKEPPKPPKPVEQKAEVKKEAVKTLTEAKPQQKAEAAAANPLDKLQKSTDGMPSIGAKQPDFKLAGENKAGPKGASGGPVGGGNGQAGGARKGQSKSNVYGVEGVDNNKASGVNLSKLGLGVGKVLNQAGPGAIATDFKSSVGGAGGGSGSASKTYGLGGGDGRRQSLGLGGGEGATQFGAGGSGGYLSGEGGKGGLGGSGLGRGAGGGRARPEVELPAEDPVVSGGLTNQEISAVIRANLNQIRHCYEQLLQRSPSAQGKLTTGFVIGTDGSVTSSEIKAGTLADSVMQGCVTSRIARWKFPKPRGGQPVTVTYPFVFTPA